MFGTIKESILNKLEKTYSSGDELTFKKEFNRYIRTIKENKDLKEFYEVYDLFKQVNFDDSDIAKEFVEESINYLKQYDKTQIDKLATLNESIETLGEDSIEFKLDQLIFNENVSLKDKAKYKVELVKQITNKADKQIDYKSSFNTLHTKINETVSKLNETQTMILDLFIENDNEKIKGFYSDLISETEKIVEDKILVSENGDVIKKLIEVKQRLNTLKSEAPSITEIEKIVSLKESLD